MASDATTGDDGRPQIDWTSAEVRDGALTVALEPVPSAAWRKRVRALVPRLDHRHGQWGEITAKKGRLVVAGVREGAEGDLRHLLESLVLQANAAEQEQQAATAAPDGPDTRMTAAFRAFGAAAEPENGLPRRMLGAA